MGLMLSIHLVGIPLLAFIYLAQEFIIANRGSNTAINLTRHLHPPLISFMKAVLIRRGRIPLGLLKDN